MAARVLWSAVVWTLRGLLCTWRFFWVSPYDAVNAVRWTQAADETAPKAPSKQRPDETSASCVRHERTGTLHRRLVNAEGEIQQLKREIYNQRASWEMRFVELQKRQHDLRDKLTSEILVRSGMLYREADLEEENEVFTESGLGNGHSEEMQQRCSAALRNIHLQKANEMGMFREDADQKSLCGSQASWSTVVDMSSNTSVRSWRSAGGRPHRVFLPHSPLDLKIGHRVRVMLPSGRISTGTLRYLGYVQNSSDCHLGVELELADNGQHDGTYEGQHYFTWYEPCIYHSVHMYVGGWESLFYTFLKRLAQIKPFNDG